MSLHREDRELQIRLAELQADIQIYVTVCFGLFAGFVALIIGFEQIYFSLSPEEVVTKTSIFILIILGGIVCLSFSVFFLRKMFDARKQMEELRKQYAW